MSANSHPRTHSLLRRRPGGAGPGSRYPGPRPLSYKPIIFSGPHPPQLCASPSCLAYQPLGPDTRHSLSAVPGQLHAHSDPPPELGPCTTASPSRPSTDSVGATELSRDAHFSASNSSSAPSGALAARPANSAPLASVSAFPALGRRFSPRHAPLCRGQAGQR